MLATVDETATSVLTIDELIATTLRGANVGWRGGSGVAFVEAFLDRCDYHGVGALVHDHLKRQPGWPTPVREALRERALAQSMWELRHQHNLKQIISELSQRGVRPVIFKGTALAYMLYANPAVRARGDTDLIIPPHDRAQVASLLTSEGFQRNSGVSGQFISYQATYTLEARGCGQHDIDLHWRINNSEVLSRLFSYEDLYSKSVPLPRLCSDALAASPVHALLLACMHRAVHKQSPYYVNGKTYYSGDRLIWLYDIHLLARNLTRTHWYDVVNEAQQKGLSSVCLEGLERATAHLHTRIPDLVSAALKKADKDERAAVYLNGGRLRRAQMDFAAIEGAANKLRFVREVIFPPASYMRSKFPNAPTFQLPWLYARRAAGGAMKRLRPTRSTP